jgi:hypothetical protein
MVDLEERLKLLEEKLNKEGRIVNILGRETIIIRDLKGLKAEFIALYLTTYPYKSIFVYDGKGNEVINIYFDESVGVCKIEIFDVYRIPSPYGKKIREILGIETPSYIL